MTGAYDTAGVRAERAPACYLCGGPPSPLYTDRPDQLYGAPGRWNLSRCRDCGLAWLDPRPVADDFRRLYSEYYHYTHGSPHDEPQGLARVAKAVERHVLAAAFGYEELARHRGSRTLGPFLSGLGPTRNIFGGTVLWLKACPGGRLLDVGCGSGQFLAHMRDLGWDVNGIEPDPVAVRVAQEDFGLNVRQGGLEEAAFSGASFDAVTVSHVIEHVPDPIALLKECRRVLSPGGRLVVVTPNSESLGRRFLDASWFLGWSPPWHLFIFSVPALRLCADRAGLQVHQVKTTARKAWAGWYVNRLLQRCAPIPVLQRTRRPLFLRLRLGLEGLALWVLESLSLLVRPWGEEIVMVAGA